MTFPAIPVVFEPIYKSKPWGGRELARLYDKVLPGDEPIGESWELVDLPGNESRVARGPLAGMTIGELMEMWGGDLLGDAEPIDGRFPLLIKFLDARERLSVQVHPRNEPGIKHEAWYVVDAESEAGLYLGLKPGVGLEDVRAAGSTPALVELHNYRLAKAGQCFYLPSGIPHALGAGLVVAEIQTPSDVTYRLYDWERVGLDGRPRELHVEQALANLCADVTECEIVQPRIKTSDGPREIERVVECERFTIEHVRIEAGNLGWVSSGGMVIWIILAGEGSLAAERGRCDFHAGEVVLIPAKAKANSVHVELVAASEVLRVTIPSVKASASGV